MAAHTEHICRGRQKRDKCGGVLGCNKRGSCSVRRGLGGSPVQVLVADHRGKIAGRSRGAGLLSEVPLSKVVNPQTSGAAHSDSSPIRRHVRLVEREGWPCARRAKGSMNSLEVCVAEKKLSCGKHVHRRGGTAASFLSTCPKWTR